MFIWRNMLTSKLYTTEFHVLYIIRNAVLYVEFVKKSIIKSDMIYIIMDIVLYGRMSRY